MSPSFIQQQIYGLSEECIDYESLEVPVHRDVVTSFRALRRDAQDQGYSIYIVSGFRSFERQLHIWNQKAEGKRPVLDESGAEIDLAQLSEWQRVQAILRWSALPGLSRHHWGTDFDVIDKSAVGDDYQVQLVPGEVETGGPFAPMHDWLDEYFKHLSTAQFFRPYGVDRGGVAPERWHLSYAPVAAEFESAFLLSELHDILEQQPLLLKEAVLTHLEDIVERYFSDNCGRY